jgi:hypothetical protein
MPYIFTIEHSQKIYAVIFNAFKSLLHYLKLFLQSRRPPIERYQITECYDYIEDKVSKGNTLARIFGKAKN